MPGGVIHIRDAQEFLRNRLQLRPLALNTGVTWIMLPSPRNFQVPVTQTCGHVTSLGSKGTLQMRLSYGC